MGEAEVQRGAADVVAGGAGADADADADADACPDAGGAVDDCDDGCGVCGEGNSGRRDNCRPAEEVVEKEGEKEGGKHGRTELVQPGTEPVAATTKAASVATAEQGTPNELSVTAPLGEYDEGEQQWARGLRRMIDGGSPLVSTGEGGNGPARL